MFTYEVEQLFCPFYPLNSILLPLTNKIPLIGMHLWSLIFYATSIKNGLHDYYEARTLCIDCKLAISMFHSNIWMAICDECNHFINRQLRWRRWCWLDWWDLGLIILALFWFSFIFFLKFVCFFWFSLFVFGLFLFFRSFWWRSFFAFWLISRFLWFLSISFFLTLGSFLAWHS